MEKEFLIRRTLVNAIVESRVFKGDKVARSLVASEIQRYMADCQIEGFSPPRWWISLLRGLAEGKDIIQLLDELELYPYGFTLLNILERLRDNGFPQGFLVKIIEDAAPGIGEEKVPIFKQNLGII